MDVLLRLFAAALLTIAIICFGVFLFGGLHHRDEIAATLCGALAALNLRRCVIRIGHRTRRQGIWLDFLQPILMAIFTTMGGVALICMMFLSRRFGDEESLMAFGFLVAAVVFGSVVHGMRGDATAAPSTQRRSDRV